MSAEPQGPGFATPEATTGLANSFTSNPSLGAAALEGAAVAAAGIGPTLIQDWAANRLGQQAFDDALAKARPLITASIREQSLAIQAIRDRSQQDKVVACVQVTKATMYQGYTGLDGIMTYFPSPPTFDISPHVTFTDSIPNEKIVHHYIAQTGFGWYTNVEEKNLWFEVKSVRH